MDFNKVRVKEIRCVVNYRPSIETWTSCDRKEHIIGIQLSGEASHEFDDFCFTISENDIYFLNQRDDYRVNVIERPDALSVHFTTYDPIDMDSFCIAAPNPMKIISLLQKIDAAWKAQEDMLALSLLYHLFHEYSHVRDQLFFPKDRRMLDAREYMDFHFHEEGCLKEVIEKSGLGVRRFRDLFHDAFRMTPNQYIITRKIEHAKGLLSAGGLTISEIALLCGFADVYYFSKVFKKETGITPSKWK